MKLMLQCGQIELKAVRQTEDLKIIAAGRRLDFAAMGAEEGGVGVPNRARPTLDRNRGIDDVEHS
jgi:hypothetical protein